MVFVTEYTGSESFVHPEQYLADPSRMHVFQDLRPYVCLADSCPDLLQTFPTRDAWAEHDRTHRQKTTFVCQSCRCACLTRDQFENHLSQDHVELTSEQQRELMSTAVRIRVDDVNLWSCLLCNMGEFSSAHKFKSHVCQHLEDIALAAVPLELYPDEHADSAHYEGCSDLTSDGNLDDAQVVAPKQVKNTSSILAEIRQSFAVLDVGVQKEAEALELEYPGSLSKGTSAATIWSAKTRLAYGRAIQRGRIAHQKMSQLEIDDLSVREQQGNSSIREDSNGQDDIQMLALDRALQESQDFLERFESEQTKLRREREFRQSKQDILLHSLVYHGMHSQLRNLSTAAPGTCSWILDHRAYTDWADRSNTMGHNRILWIMGSAGAGKSTLMKFLFEWTKHEKLDQISVQYFFKAGSSSMLEKSSLGVYRSIVHQLLSSLSLASFEWTTRFSTKELDGDIQDWTVSDLQDTISEILVNPQCPKVNIFIDALDEGAEMNDVLQMVGTLSGLLGGPTFSSGSNHRLCFSSRPFPEYNVTGDLTIVLENQQAHSRAIERYSEAKLLGDRGDPRMETLRRAICERSAGSFLWVVLVVAELKEAYYRGQSANKMLETFWRLPANLHDLRQYLQSAEERD